MSYSNNLTVATFNIYYTEIVHINALKIFTDFFFQYRLKKYLVTHYQLLLRY